MLLPIVIVSPAILQWNGYSYYTKVGIKSEFKRETFKIESDTDGTIDERMKHQITEVSFQPVGMIKLGADTSLSAFFPYPISRIGQSIFGPAGARQQLVIATKFGGANNAGLTITFPNAAISKLPPLRLRPTDTLFGDMTFTCIGDATIQPNTNAAWLTLANAAFADNNFDETAIVTDIYSAAYGNAPYNAMASMAGFEIDIAMETANIEADDYGIADIILKSLTAAVKFAPSNLTEAQIQALLAAQGASYVYPGQSLSKANTNLVITGSGNGARTLTATIYNAGPKEAGFMYNVDKHRLDAIGFTSKRTWTAGVANPLWSFAVA